MSNFNVNTENGILLEKPHDACHFGNCLRPYSVSTTTTVTEDDGTTTTKTIMVSGNCCFKVFTVHGCGKKYCEDHAGKENHIAKKNCCIECWDRSGAEIRQQMKAWERRKRCIQIPAIIIAAFAFIGFGVCGTLFFTPGIIFCGVLWCLSVTVILPSSFSWVGKIQGRQIFIT